MRSLHHVHRRRLDFFQTHKISAHVPIPITIYFDNLYNDRKMYMWTENLEEVRPFRGRISFNGSKKILHIFSG